MVSYYDTSAYIKFCVVLDNTLKLRVQSMENKAISVVAEAEIQNADGIYLKTSASGPERLFCYSFDNLKLKNVHS